MAQGGAMMAGQSVQGQINKQMNQYFNQEGDWPHLYHT